MFGLLALLLAGSPGAQTIYPSKPIRLVGGFAPGTQLDTLARIIGQKMSESWGQPVVVDNRTGGGGMLAAGILANAVPDGHTLFFGNGFAITVALQPTFSYNPLKDFAGVAQIGFPTQALIVAPSLGVRSVKDLIALAQSQPGKIIYGFGGSGSESHLNGERFRGAVGIKVVNVAFKSGVEALLQTLAGRTHYCFAGLLPALPFIQDGKLLALAVNAPQRLAILPDVPALAETLPVFNKPESSNGLLAPAKTPRSVLTQISKEAARILDLPDIKERMQAMGFVPAPSTPEDYDQIRREQIETLSKLAIEAGLRAK